MEKREICIFVCTLLITTIILPATNADNQISSELGEIKDQYQEWSDECIYISDYEWQEFVPTRDNLVRVEVKIVQWYSGSPNIKLTIEKPLGNVLTHKELPASVIPSGTCDWTSFDVSNIPLTPGDSYYINITAPIGSEYGWGIAYNGLYPNGTSSQDPADWCFRTYGVDTTPPHIKIIKPEKALYFFNIKLFQFPLPFAIGTIEAKTLTYDNESGINKVEFYLDNTLQTSDTTSPYTWTWNTPSLSMHTIKAVAYDNAGNHAEDSINVLKIL